MLDEILSQNLYVLTTTDNITISDIQCAGPGVGKICSLPEWYDLLTI